MGPERTFDQDPRYAIRLLVDIAIRALSPAINDPTTAVQALDQIEDLLLRLGRSRLQVGPARDAAGTLRLVIPQPTWEDFVVLAFEEIRYSGATSVQIMHASYEGLDQRFDFCLTERASPSSSSLSRETRLDHCPVV
jgi:uncharacterized membrane protein